MLLGSEHKYFFPAIINWGAALLISFVLLSCTKEDECPKGNLGILELAEESLSFLPYEEGDMLRFSNSDGATIDLVVDFTIPFISHDTIITVGPVKIGCDGYFDGEQKAVHLVSEDAQLDLIIVVTVSSLTNELAPNSFVFFDELRASINQYEGEAFIADSFIRIVTSYKNGAGPANLPANYEDFNFTENLVDMGQTLRNVYYSKGRDTRYNIYLSKEGLVGIRLENELYLLQ